ncbi:MAG: PIN domain-containing protein [Cyanobacteria bacterium CRU_2_1]|nr:PIN domain-containing protein [Cyanobacteria bacterium RU_5_0]NJR62204.1 PIN domain-containing protein [Cyanobacteria bacterium CRU_2_1]
MSYPPVILIDSGVLVAYYSAKDEHHQRACAFFEQCTSQLVTTLGCATEVMWLLSSNWRTQNEFLSDLAKELYTLEPLTLGDFSRITELNTRYADLPADFADLSLIAISERLNIAAILTLDRDFDIYRRYRTQPFNRVFLPT